jgi:hypothetical protein
LEHQFIRLYLTLAEGEKRSSVPQIYAVPEGCAKKRIQPSKLIFERIFKNRQTGKHLEETV